MEDIIAHWCVGGKGPVKMGQEMMLQHRKGQFPEKCPWTSEKGWNPPAPVMVGT
jgi:hypothetical protein